MKNKSTNTRTRSGCLTCRDRHMKCDEGLPTCNNCKKLSRKCLRGLRLNFIQYLTYDPQEFGKEGLERTHFSTHRIIDQLITIASLYKNGLHKYKPFLKYHSKEELNEAKMLFHELLKKFENRSNSIPNNSSSINSIDSIEIEKASKRVDRGDNINRNWQKPYSIEPPHYLSYHGISNQIRPTVSEDFNRQLGYGPLVSYRDQMRHPMHNQTNILPANINSFQKEVQIHEPNSISRSSVNLLSTTNNTANPHSTSWRHDSDTSPMTSTYHPVSNSQTRSNSDQFFSSSQYESSSISHNLGTDNSSFNVNNDFTGFGTNSFVTRQVSGVNNDQKPVSETFAPNIKEKMMSVTWFADLFNDLKLWEKILPAYLNQAGIQNFLMNLCMSRILESSLYYNNLIVDSEEHEQLQKIRQGQSFHLRDVNKVQEIFDLQMRFVNQYGPGSHIEVLFSIVTLLSELLIVIVLLELSFGHSRKLPFEVEKSGSYELNSIFHQQIDLFNFIQKQLHPQQNQLAQAILISLIHLVIILKFVVSMKLFGKLSPLNDLEVNFLKNPSIYGYSVFTKDELYRELPVNKDSDALVPDQFKQSNISDLGGNKTLGGLYTDSFLLCNQFWSLIRSFYTRNDEYQYGFGELLFEITQLAPNLVTPQNYDPFKHSMSDQSLALSIAVQAENRIKKPEMIDLSTNNIRSMLYDGQLRCINEPEMKNAWQIFFNWSLE